MQRLAAQGVSRAAISRITGISRSAIREWLAGRYPGWQADAGLATPRAVCAICDGETIVEPLYSYLLGQYLGDGSIVTMRNRVFRLVISTDAKYTGIIAECVSALEGVFPSSKVSVRKAVVGECYNVMIHSKHVTCYFPQHGPGRKHLRKIELLDWQREIVEHHPQMLIRGLIHSDGCRVVNRIRRRLKDGVRSYSYLRYFFSNESTDIQKIFTDVLDLLGIAWRRNRPNSISVARRDAVARLDAFVGPKA